MIGNRNILGPFGLKVIFNFFPKALLVQLRFAPICFLWFKSVGFCHATTPHSSGLGWRGASETSLMLTPKEMAHLPPRGLGTHQRRGCLRCDGLIWSKDGRACVWLNGKGYTVKQDRSRNLKQQPEDKNTLSWHARHDDDIIIHAMTRDFVVLSWFFRGVEHHIKLKPNQTYSARLKAIIG